MILDPRLSKLLKDGAVCRVRQDHERVLRGQLSVVQERLRESANMSASRKPVDPVFQHFAEFRDPLVAEEAKRRRQIAELNGAKIQAEGPVRKGDAWVVTVEFCDARQDLVIDELPNLDDPVQSVAERFDDGQPSVVQSLPKKRQSRVRSQGKGRR
jgi:hypothetical protein